MAHWFYVTFQSCKHYFSVFFFFKFYTEFIYVQRCLTGEQVIRTAGRFCRTGDQAVQTDANFFERMTQVVRTNANFFQTGSKWNSIRKPKAVIARFRVKGHI